MRRYTFLLLAFFLGFSAHAEGLGFSTSMMGVSAAPQGLSDQEGEALRSGQEKKKASKNKKISRKIAYSNPKAVKETSSRNINELGNISESTQRAQQPTTNTQLNTQTTGVPNLANKKGKTALSAVSCKTYEGKTYEQGEAGYNDCIRTIKTDRQAEKVVP